MSLIALYERSENADCAKRIRRYNEYLRKFYDRPSRFRFPPKAKRYSDQQYATVLRCRTLMSTVMLDERGLVKSNFALAEVANRFPHPWHTVRFADMTKVDIEAFVEALKEVARRHRWSDEMLDIELQFLDGYR